MRRSVTVGRVKRALLVVAVPAFGLVASCGSAQPPLPEALPTPAAPNPSVLDVDTNRAVAHLRALQKIADDNGGNRASGHRGYEASVEYVAGALRRAGLDVVTPSYELSAEDREDGGSGPARPRNVIAQTRGGDPRHVVMIGAHLDSVAGGPGIVDDGSGVAAVLEIATRLTTAPPGGNTVRFGFFGSEESGGQGSAAYVDSISDADRRKIMCYINVDMIASTNGGYLVQGGTGGDVSESGPPKSAGVAQVLIDQLAATGVTAVRIPFVGDDEATFIEVGIPTAGAENGDEKKTAAQATSWGGAAGQGYDRCYHQACDRVDNVNRQVFDRYLRALAGTVVHYAAPQNVVSR